ncbi:helix-turn-helix domain-containing protein [Nocardioides sp. NPDC126508]
MTSSRAHIASRANADAPELVDTIVAAVVQAIPAYAALDSRQVEEVRSIAGWTLRRVLELWASDSEPDDTDTHRFRGVGAVRARDGRPLAAVQRAYRTVGPHLLDILSKRYGDQLTATDVTALSRAYLRLLDVVSEAIQEGYEASARTMSADRETSLRQLVTDIMRGRQTYEGSLAARLRELDTRLPKTFDVLVVGPGQGQVVELDALDVAFSDNGVNLRARVDGLSVVILGGSEDTPVRAGALVGNAGATAVLLRSVTTKHVPRLFRIATAALRHRAARSGTLFTRGDVEAIAILTGHHDGDPQALVAAVIGPLVSEPELLRTLEAVLWAGSDTRAAADLGLHPQTVRYRLRGISAATGRDPRRQWDRFVLLAALTARA